MEYDSRPRTKLFSVVDKDEETKELFFIGRKAMAVLGTIAFGVVAGAIYFFSENILISLGIGVAVGLPMGFLPILMDQKKEEYFTPLINKIIEILEEFEIETTKENIMDLLSFKEIRISTEHVLLADTKEGKLSVYVASDPKPKKVKTKKPSIFPVVVTEKAESDIKDKPVLVASEEPKALEAGSKSTNEVTEVPEKEKVHDSIEAEIIPDKPLNISSFVTSGNAHTAVSTHAIDIVSPAPKGHIPTIGEIAPGVTGPIPITVGDRSIIHEEDEFVVMQNLGDHVDPYVAPLTGPVPVQSAKGRHGRRSAAQ